MIKARKHKVGEPFSLSCKGCDKVFESKHSNALLRLCRLSQQITTNPALFGTLLGVLVITLIGNGLVLLGINSFFQQVVRGVIIVVAVLANILLTQRSSKAKR